MLLRRGVGPIEENVSSEEARGLFFCGEFVTSDKNF